MVEAEAVGDPAAAVVAGQHEAFVAQRRHDLDHVLGHGALGVPGVIRSAVWLGTVAVAAEIGADEGEALGQDRGDAVPDRVGLRVAVQQEQGRPLPARTQEDLGAAGSDPVGGEALEHGGFLGRIAHQVE